MILIGLILLASNSYAQKIIPFNANLEDKLIEYIITADGISEDFIEEIKHFVEFAKQNNIPGICSESEWGPIKRDLELAEKTGCKYHICHVSTKESVELIRQAKKDGVNITCETGPHYLVLSDKDLQEKFLNVISSEAVRMTKLVNDLLTSLPILTLPDIVQYNHISTLLFG